MLSKLGIRQRLSLLLALPLLVVVITAVPFTAERIDDARVYSATARAARAAHDIGVLAQNLQRERLFALGYLVLPQLDRTALIAQMQHVAEETTRLRTAADTRAALVRAAEPLEALAALRERVVSHAVTVAEAYQAYRRAVASLLAAPELAAPRQPGRGFDPAGLGRLDALAALMRADEEASSAGAALVALATDPRQRLSLSAALAARGQHDERFRQLGDRSHVSLVDRVENGAAASRVRQLAAVVGEPGGTSGPPPATALTAAMSYTVLRGVAQERIAHDIAEAADARAATARAAAGGLAAGAGLMVALIVGLSVALGRSISRPLRRLAGAAGRVADLAAAELKRVADTDDAAPAPPRLAAVDIRSDDELGELAAAFNRVQATAALLLERQVSTRWNVSVMFANVARRTQALVGRQRVLIDELERTEQNPELLEKLYRLDHVSTRLHRSADALLVISGNRGDGATELPMSLADVVRSAIAEIEGYRSVRLGAICDVGVAVELVDDLRLLLAELLENAASFSPPGALVDVCAQLDDACVVSIVDHGIGMTPARQAEENHRLVDRERLEVAPTTVLGLFVVGRLARRHGLSVHLGATPGHGVTATVTVPARLLVPGPAARPGGPLPTPRRAPGRSVVAAVAELVRAPDPFPWFEEPQGRTATPPAVAGSAASALAASALAAPALAAPANGGSTRDGLTRRRPGASMTPFDTSPRVVGAGRDQRAERDAVAERDDLEAFTRGTARASGQPAGTEVADPAGAPPTPPTQPVSSTPPAPPAAASASPAAASAAPAAASAAPETRGGLTRRVPGAHVNESTATAAVPRRATRTGRRHPDAERAALDDFVDGIARAHPSEPTTGD